MVVLQFGAVKRCAVILGAGASAGVSLGGYPVNQEWCPPLAREIFDVAAHPEYAPILEKYAGALSLSTPLYVAAKRGEQFELEKMLRCFAYESDEVTQRNFREIPFYLRDLLNEVSRRYTRSPEAYSMLVRRLLAEQPHEVAFVTLNYDTLLEGALRLHDATAYPLHSIGNYVAPRRRAMIIKLHGSVNWFRPCGSAGHSWEECIAAFDLHRPTYRHDESSPVDLDIRVVDMKGAARETTAPNGASKSWLYPVVTAPLAGKGPEAVVCPETHLARLKEFLKDCRKFLIIGTSGLDEDLLHLLNATATAESYLVIVGKGDAANDVANRFRAGVAAFDSAQHLVVHRIGFAEFVQSAALAQFASA